MGIVYVLTNPALDGLVKIGCTTKSVNKRITDLSRGMPYPYECVAAWEFDDHRGAERALHEAFADSRESKEFFKVKPARVVALLKQFGRRSVPLDEEPEAIPRETAKDVEQSLPRKQGRKRFRFPKVGIRPGALLFSIWDDNITCRVVDQKRVEYAGEVMSLSAAAKTVARELGKKTYERAGPRCWCYGAPPKTLDKLRDEH